MLIVVRAYRLTCGFSTVLEYEKMKHLHTISTSRPALAQFGGNPLLEKVTLISALVSLLALLREELGIDLLGKGDTA